MSDFTMNLQLFAAPAVETGSNPRDYLPNNFSTAIHAREVDFVTRFSDNWDALIQLLGIMRPIRKTPGTQLVSYEAKVTLAENQAVPGAVIPYSKAEIVPKYKEDLKLELFVAGTTIQDIEKYGAQIAVEKVDDAFLTALQLQIMFNFYSFLRTGTLRSTAKTWQMALAQAQGQILNKFMAIRRNVTEVVGFANVNDAYEYLGNTTITTQTSIGLTYLKDFLGYSTLLLLPDNLLPRGMVIATPSENIDLYYIDPADGDFASAGLVYTVKGVTNLIGFHAQGNYSTAVGESYAVTGMKLWAEYLDGIAVVEINADPFDRATVAGAPQTNEYWGHQVSEFQANDIAVHGSAITGTLYDFDGWDSGPLAGEGHFIALKFSGLDSGATGAKVGLVPSESGMDLQTLDSDMDAVFKISDKNRQYLVVQQFDAAGNITIDTYSLAGLTYAPAPAPGA